MTLKDLSKSVSGILGKPEKQVTKPQMDILRREISNLEKEYGKIDLWDSLRSQDKTEAFKSIVNSMIEDVKERYGTISKDDLTHLQNKHTLLKEMLYFYENCETIKHGIVQQMNDKRAKYDKGINT